MRIITLFSLWGLFALVVGYNMHPYEQCKRKEHVNTMEDIMACVDILETPQ